MNRQAAARTAGTLFLTAFVAGAAGVLFLRHKDEPDFLATAATEYSQSTAAGALLLLVMALAVVLIPVVLYPVFKQQDEALALGYVVLRIVEALILTVAAFVPLALLELSREYAAADAAKAAGYEAVSDTLLAYDYWGEPISQIVWALSVVVLSYLLYRGNLVPRFISLWGLIGAPLYLVSQAVVLFDPPSPFSVVEVVLTGQIALNELVLAIWLVAKGFRSTPAVVAEAARVA